VQAGENLFVGSVGKVIPNRLSWTSEPTRWMFDEYNHLILQPRPGTDFMASYIGSDTKAAVRQDACFLYYVTKSNFTITAKVGGSFPTNGDGVAVTVWATPELFAKICVQKTKNTKQGEYQIVSTVTNPFSDYSFSEIITTTDCWLRISRKGTEFAMHYSKDNKRWKFVRYFVWNEMAQPTEPDLAIGIHAQSPNSIPNPLNGSITLSSTPQPLPQTGNVRSSTTALNSQNVNILSSLACCTAEVHDFIVSGDPIKDMKPNE